MDGSSPAKAGTGQRIGTALLIAGPVVAVAISVPVLWGRALHWRDLVLGIVLYVITGHGVTVGFHRMFTHNSFRAKRPLKLALGIAGSMAFQGSLVSWVANHRRHHVHSDQLGDPHTPHGASMSRGRGFVHAHLGWLFRPDTTSAARYAPDLLKDRDAMLLSRLFPLFATASLALPFGVGWALSGTLRGAVTALVWGGLVRMALLHHATWSINSICHVTGRHPFRTSDHSGNVAALAVISMGESWHNLHHALPSLARHGVDRGQLDTSAWLIARFEQLGWATKVRWPTPQRLAAVRRSGRRVRPFGGRRGRGCSRRGRSGTQRRTG